MQVVSIHMVREGRFLSIWKRVCCLECKLLVERGYFFEAEVVYNASISTIWTPSECLLRYISRSPFRIRLSPPPSAPPSSLVQKASYFSSQRCLTGRNEGRTHGRDAVERTYDLLESLLSIHILTYSPSSTSRRKVR